MKTSQSMLLDSMVHAQSVTPTSPALGKGRETMGPKLRILLMAGGCLAAVVAFSHLAAAEPLYRLWNSGVTDHFYTANATEALNATRGGWVSEGNVGECDPQSSETTTPLYRLWNSSGVDHFYTTDSRERDRAISALGYVSEGIACWVHGSEALGTCPLYRMYNSGAIDHFYTLSWDEASSAMSVGYVYQGIAAYMGSPGGCTN
jgi:hypothetical protein